MILSDVNIIHRRTHYEGEAEDFEVTDIVVGSREENSPGRSSKMQKRVFELEVKVALGFH